MKSDLNPEAVRLQQVKRDRPKAELLENLRDLVAQTKALNDGAKAEVELVKQRYEDLGPAHAEVSLRHAANVERFTFRAYIKALSYYNDFVLRGK